MLEDEESSIQEITRLLRQSPPVSAEILRVANSVHYRRGPRIADIQRAVSTVGLRRAHRLALAFCLRGLLEPVAQYPVLHTCWETAISTAVLSEALAGAFQIRPGKAYTAGLLHNVGCLALSAAYPSAYAQMLDLNRTHEFSLIESERSLFDTDHHAVGAWLVDHYGLPAEFSAVAAEYGDDSLNSRDLVTLVRAGHRLSLLLGLRPDGSTDETKAVRALIRNLPIDDPETALTQVSAAYPYLLEVQS